MVVAREIIINRLKFVATVEHELVEVVAGVAGFAKQILPESVHPVQFICEPLAAILVPLKYLSEMSEGYLQQCSIVGDRKLVPRKGCTCSSDIMVIVGAQSTVVLLYHLDMEREAGSAPPMADWT